MSFPGWQRGAPFLYRPMGFTPAVFICLCGRAGRKGHSPKNSFGQLRRRLPAPGQACAHWRKAENAQTAQRGAIMAIMSPRLLDTTSVFAKDQIVFIENPNQAAQQALG